MSRYLRLQLVLCAFVASLMATTAVAAPPGGPDVLAAFPDEPVSAAVLADSYGGATGRIDRYRVLSDGNSAEFLQQVGRTSRVEMDNWWGQTGAALIYENLLARR